MSAGRLHDRERRVLPSGPGDTEVPRRRRLLSGSLRRGAPPAGLGAGGQRRCRHGPRPADRRQNGSAYRSGRPWRPRQRTTRRHVPPRPARALLQPPREPVDRLAPSSSRSLFDRPSVSRVGRAHSSRSRRAPSSSRRAARRPSRVYVALPTPRGDEQPVVASADNEKLRYDGPHVTSNGSAACDTTELDLRGSPLASCEVRMMRRRWRRRRLHRRAPADRGTDGSDSDRRTGRPRCPLRAARRLGAAARARGHPPCTQRPGARRRPGGAGGGAGKAHRHAAAARACPRPAHSRDHHRRRDRPHPAR